jgi:hypothetical protein
MEIMEANGEFDGNLYDYEKDPNGTKNDAYNRDDDAVAH